MVLPPESDATRFDAALRTELCADNGAGRKGSIAQS